jgi:predicted nucleic acid-binding protein
VSFLLDTNVICELRKPVPDPAVARWFSRVHEDQMAICVLTLGEIQSGITRLDSGSKKAELILWFDRLKESFRNQIYTIDESVSLKWGEITAQWVQKGNPLPAVDGLIAACAISNYATLVTRNTGDFERTGVELLNPWEY